MKAATLELEPNPAASPQLLHVKKILVPIDFSGPSKKAFEYALRFAQQFGSEIVLIHVLDPGANVGGTQVAGEFPPRSDDEVSIAEKKLQALANSSWPSGTLYINSTVRAGAAAHEIIEAAEEFDVDLIITATHGLSGWKHFGMGNTAERVSRAASCPVLIVREKEHEFI